jgi:hypothetical protein
MSKHMHCLGLALVLVSTPVFGHERETEAMKAHNQRSIEQRQCPSTADEHEPRRSCMGSPRMLTIVLCLIQRFLSQEAMLRMGLACGMCTAVLLVSLVAAAPVMAAADSPTERSRQTTLAQAQEMILECTTTNHKLKGFERTDYTYNNKNVIKIQNIGGNTRVFGNGDEKRVTAVTDTEIRFESQIGPVYYTINRYTLEYTYYQPSEWTIVGEGSCRRVERQF